jgi:N-acylglucosamine-6-phosphate 2-epimerase
MEIEQLRGGLIVSCQAPTGSPLDDPFIISAMALVAAQQGAVGVRLNGATHIAATRARTRLPIIGLEKVVTGGSEVYITPTFAVAERIAHSGADIIAIDATNRLRPNNEKIGPLLRRMREELQKPVLADIATFDEALGAAEQGADMVATTLCGYTQESTGVALPALALLEKLAHRLSVPIICEGGVTTPEQVRQAFDCGAFAVVVGTAITGITQLAQKFIAATPQTR